MKKGTKPNGWHYEAWVSGGELVFDKALWWDCETSPDLVVIRWSGDDEPSAEDVQVIPRVRLCCTKLAAVEAELDEIQETRESLKKREATFQEFVDKNRGVH